MNHDEQIILGEGNVRELSFRFEDTNITLLRDTGFLPPRNAEYSGKLRTLHSHKHYEMWSFNAETKLLFSDRTVTFHEGEIAVIPPNVEHTLIQKENQSSRNPAIQFHITQVSAKSNFPLFKMLSDLFSAPYFSIMAPKRICEIVDHFNRYSADNILKDFLQSSLAFYELIVFLLVTSPGSEKSSRSYPLSSTNSSHSYKIIMMIENFSSKKLTIDKIANALSLSTRQTERIIEDLFGTTFKNLLISKRMKEAAIFLLTTDMTTNEIASKVGYNSPKGFYSIFRKYYGCTPTEFRKKNKQTD